MKRSFPVDVSYGQKTTRHRWENTTVAIICFNCFTLAETDKITKKISRFYSNLQIRFEKWIENTFLNYAAERYISDSSPRKKFRYVPLSLEYRSTAEVTDGAYLKVKIVITLSCENEVISIKDFDHLWDLKTGGMLIKRKKKRRETLN